MMRTEAPKDRVGRGVVNLARTTPELPIITSQYTIPLSLPDKGDMYREAW